MWTEPIWVRAGLAETRKGPGFGYRGGRWINYTAEPLTPALSPSEGERENHRQISV